MLLVSFRNRFSVSKPERATPTSRMSSRAHLRGAFLLSTTARGFPGRLRRSTFKTSFVHLRQRPATATLRITTTSFEGVCVCPRTNLYPTEGLLASVEEAVDVIRQTAQAAAKRLLQQALEEEVAKHVNEHTEKRDKEGERKAVAVDPNHKRFVSGVLPRFLRKTPSVEGVVAVFYLKGISTNDFDAALQAIYGENAGNLSAATVSRLTKIWQQEYEQWRTKPLSASQYADIWTNHSASGRRYLRFLKRQCANDAGCTSQSGR